MLKNSTSHSVIILKNSGLWATFAGLSLFAYWPTFKWMAQRWDEPDSYLSHGWLIPVLSGVVLWMKRSDWRAYPIRPFPAAIGLILFSLFIHGIAGLADVSSLSALTLIGLIAGFFWLQYGTSRLKVAWFPLAYLFFMVPWPDFIVSGLGFKLKLLATDLATHLLNVTGLTAVRSGAYLLFGEEKLAVGDVCSGLSSLMTLIALAVLYAYLLRRKGSATVIAVLLAAAPAAVAGNVLRITVVAWLVQLIGKEAVFRPLVGDWDLHLITGGVLFVGAFATVFAAALAAEALTGKGHRPSSTTDTNRPRT